MRATRATKALPSIVARTAIFLYAAAQLCLALAAVSEGRFGADARSHVEAAGTSIHHAHDEAGCAACTARAMLSMVSPSDRPIFSINGKSARAASSLDIRADIPGSPHARPRAPPVRQA